MTSGRWTDTPPTTPLRRSYECARQLDLRGQVRECTDQLGHPEVIVGEVLEAFHVIDEWCGSVELESAKNEPVEELVLGHEECGERFYPTREIRVTSGDFTCLASGVNPLGDLHATPDLAEDGLDFVGVTRDADRMPILGTVESERDRAAYPLLLRGLACLTEMAPQPQVDRLNNQLFLGLLGVRPSFDLYLVLMDQFELEERTALEQLTRDLAEKLKQAIHQHARFPQILRDIVCLRMEPEGLDDGLRLEWRV